MKFRSTLIAALFTIFGVGCIHPSPTPTPTAKPLPATPMSLKVSLTATVSDSVGYSLQCVVPTNPPGGPIEACRWNISVNGTPLTVQPADGFTATVTVLKPAASQTVNFSATAWSVRRGLVSVSSVTQPWSYTEADVAPPPAADITGAITSTIDSVLLNMACSFTTGQQIESCRWTVVKTVSGVAGSVSLPVPDGFTAHVASVHPAPNQTITYQVAVVTVRRGMTSTPFTKTYIFTEPDTPPPPPFNFTINFIVIGG